MRSLFLAALAGCLSAGAAHAQNLLENGSFEEPQVSTRTPHSTGGSPLNVQGQRTWEAFAVSSETAGGRVLAGLTNEIARTGKQSLFVDFAKVTASARAAVLRTGLVAVKGGQTYRVSMWGRIDRKRPLCLDERRPHMLLEARFFAADAKTEAGERIAGAQLIPGSVVPGSTPELLFRSSKWKESSALITPAEGAAFMQITWTWTTPSDEGETDGVIYWDDASVTEAPTQK